MPLFQILRQSFQSPNFYKSLRLRPLKASLAFFTYLVLIFALIITFFTAGFALPKFFSWAGNLGSAIADNFPNNLNITIRNGVISTNATSSVSVPIGESLRNETMDWPGPVAENLLIVDTNVRDSVKAIDSQRTLIFVGQDGVAFRSETGTVFQPAKELPDTEIRKDLLQGLKNFFQKLGGWLGVIITVVIFLVVFVLELSILLDLILGALIVRFVARVRGTILSYKEAYQASMHLSAAALTIYLVFGVLLLGVVTPFFPFLIMVLIFSTWTNYPPSNKKKKSGGKNAPVEKNTGKEVKGGETKENAPAEVAPKTEEKKEDLSGEGPTGDSSQS